MGVGDPQAGAEAAELLQGGALERGGHVGEGEGGREGLAEREQHSAAAGEVVGATRRLRGQLAQPALRQRRRAGRGDVLEHREVVLAPGPGPVVDGAQRADHEAGVVGERPAGVGDHVEVDDRAVGAQPVVEAGVLDDQGGGVGHDVLAHRVRQRGLAHGLDLGRQAHGAGEPLPLGLDQGHQGHRHVEQALHHAGIRVVRRGVEDPGRDDAAHRRGLLGVDRVDGTACRASHLRLRRFSPGWPARARRPPPTVGAPSCAPS